MTISVTGYTEQVLDCIDQSMMRDEFTRIEVSGNCEGCGADLTKIDCDHCGRSVFSNPFEELA